MFTFTNTVFLAICGCIPGKYSIANTIIAILSLKLQFLYDFREIVKTVHTEIVNRHLL